MEIKTIPYQVLLIDSGIFDDDCSYQGIHKLCNYPEFNWASSERYSIVVSS